jgi:hypothetical protein
MPFPVNTYVPPVHAFSISDEALKKLHIDIAHCPQYMNFNEKRVANTST